jgi:GH15 family glucan-1,4-alpha-glucosidase
MSAEEFVAAYPFLYTPSLPANSTIKADLEYISNHWPDFSYDPWEESGDMGHFFNLVITREALATGGKLARHLNDLGAAEWYELQLSEVTDYLERFWHEGDGYIKSSIDHQRGVEWKTKNLDSAVLISVLFANSSMDEDPYSISAPLYITGANGSIRPRNVHVRCTECLFRSEMADQPWRVLALFRSL